MKSYMIRILIVLCCITFTSCGTMMFLLGDNIIYTINGMVQDSKNGTYLSDVKVQVDCKGIERSIYQNKTCYTDLNGKYELSGYWPLDTCKIILDNEGYRLSQIKITENHLIRNHGLSWDYSVDVKLDPIKLN